MNVRKFFGSSTRDALRQVRDALGADALILSNRRVEGGVEIMAVADGEVQALAYGGQPQAGQGGQPQKQPAIQPETIAAILHKRQNANPVVQNVQNVRPPEFQTFKSPGMGVTGVAAYQEAAEVGNDRHVQERQEEMFPESLYVTEPEHRMPALGAAIEAADRAIEARYAVRQPAPPQLSQPQLSQSPTVSQNDPLVAEMAHELKRMRSLLESQLSGFAWGELARKDPLKAELMRTLLGCGFSPQLSRQLLDALPPNLDVERGIKWLKAALTHNLRVVESGADFITRGGVHALVGPTGVGKTTTVAKLAARAVLKFGADKVALITTDSYRIGAHEQLKIYGRILNVPVHAVKDVAELELTLADLNRSHLVLIDTVGMSQRDRRIAEQIEFLCGHGGRIKRHLILPATAQNVTLDDIVRAYRGTGMNGAILSKIDESMSIAPAIDCLIRHGMDLHYVTNGQKVPEDLHLANALYLIDRAFKSRSDQQAFAMQPEEWDVAAGNVALGERGGSFA